ncbi:hypothetical protein [Leptonema illini]|uniref:Uncharacterized protein n=1 Tax=Leptonema illini DSM 21528 TaxID=929563 RepID=H2CBX0_9LEPT|nr:hypothetical protein [Leptonema illini]EHQ08642.1 hypothetical protein Lepil_3993 [Leptonema illini DSM 21528]
MDVNKLMNYAKTVFNEMINNSDRLTNQQIEAIMGEDYSLYEDTIVSGLREIGKASRKVGPGGGIQFNPRQGAQRTLRESNISALQAYFNANLPDESVEDYTPAPDDEDYVPVIVRL